MRWLAWDLCGDGDHSNGRKSPELEVEIEEEGIEAITREIGWQWRSFVAKGGVVFAKLVKACCLLAKERPGI